MLELENICKTYDNKYNALTNVNLHVNQGEFIVLLGPSGAGKSTLLKSINQLVTVTNGSISFEGNLVKDKLELKNMRKNISMIFQSFNLVNRLTVLENVLCGRLAYNNTLLSCLRLFPKRDIEIAINSLELVGLKDKVYSRADELSGGQQQRVGIARALSQNPKVILADEPIASLDPVASKQILDILKEINKKQNITIIISLHDTRVALKYAERIVGLNNGKIILDKLIDKTTDEDLIKVYEGDYKFD